MSWRRLPNGDLRLSVLLGFEMASGAGQKVAVRLDHAETQAQLDEHAPPARVQLVMRAEDAEVLALDLIAAARRAMGAVPN